MTRYPSSPKDEVSRARLMKKYHLALLGALCLQLTGCISYSHQQQADASAWPIPLNSAKPTVSLKVDTDYQFNGTPSQRGFNLPRLERLLIKEYQSSQAFEQVALGLNTADVYAKVKVSNHETGSMLLAILSGATLLVIPGTFDNEWIMETRFFDANGKEQGRVVKREITTTWTQLLLVFALPFNESTDEILAKLARSTLEEVSQRKLL
ncbi:hypothetical protein ACNATF_26080 [Pseudomonas aeruginosa]|uniref:hypothetical protein n=1 Tax=Pseudomonas aeruginosa TaxID=287 RepID=UPI003A4D9A7F